jgi:hypothetical protein
MASFIESVTKQVNAAMADIEHIKTQYTTPSDETKGTYQGNESPKVTPRSYANTVFKLPIQYIDPSCRFALSPIVANDLELVNTLDDSIPSMYDSTFCPDTSFAEQIVPMFQNEYTTDISFLQDTQQVIRDMDVFYPPTPITYDVPCDTIQNNWTTVKHDPKFMETYGYLEWNMLKEYNKNSIVLQSLTISNMLSPIMSFLIPILFLIFPFVILKIQSVPITWEIYLKVLKDIARHHFIGKALSVFENFSMQKMMYFLFLIGLYFFQMYQNTVQCLRFYKNVQRINEELCEWKRFRNHMSRRIELFLTKYDRISTYKPFCDCLRDHTEVLQEMYYMLEPIQPFSCSISKTTEIGYMLKCYYELNTNTEYENTILYCMGFEGYLRCLYGVHKQWKEGILNSTNFTIGAPDPIQVTEVDISGEKELNNNEPPCVMRNQFYPPHTHNENCVKNDVNLDTYTIITGPNASGKTTYLKTTAINVILSQQLGFGFYSECTMKPYTHIHSYLNIPDTSGRDSLFQAESRRCKTILESIQQHDTGHHFCIFDELYSGTNPKEATQSAYVFLQFLRQYNHVDLFLTTHYVSICDKWDTDAIRDETDSLTSKDSEGKYVRPIQNCKMNCDTLESGAHVPTFKLSPGISRIEGAIEILTNMDYPEEMLSMFYDSSPEIVNV